MQINPVVISLQKLPDAFGLRCPHTHKDGLDAQSVSVLRGQGRWMKVFRIAFWSTSGLQVLLQAVASGPLTASRQQGAEYKGVSPWQVL